VLRRLRRTRPCGETRQGGHDHGVPEVRGETLGVWETRIPTMRGSRLHSVCTYSALVRPFPGGRGTDVLGLEIGGIPRSRARGSRRSIPRAPRGVSGPESKTPPGRSWSEWRPSRRSPWLRALDLDRRQDLRGPRQPAAQSRLRPLQGQTTTGSSPWRIDTRARRGGSGLPSGPRVGLVLEGPRGVELIVEPVSGDPTRGAGETVASTRTGGARWGAHPATSAGSGRITRRSAVNQA
jgi:hypothetical protein